MKRSKAPSRISSILNLAILAFFLVLVLLLATPQLNGNNMSTDAKYAYCQCIETEMVSDWHSALFMYEGIALKKIVGLFGVCLSGWAVIKCMAIIWYVALFFGIAYLINQYGNVVKYSYLVALVTGFTILVDAELGIWGLDNAFFCALVALLSSVVSLYTVKKTSYRVLLSILVLLLLWHCTEYRKNSALMVPCVMLALLLVWEVVRKWNIRRICVSVFAATGVYLFLFSLCVKGLMPLVPAHPQIPMMISDIRIAYTLQGREEELLESERLPGRPDGMYRTITAYYRLLKPGADYSEFEKFYVETWGAHPKEMLMAKMLQAVQFYMGGKTPGWIKSLVNKRYQVLHRNPDAWREYKTHSIRSSLLIGRIAPLLLMVCILPFVIKELLYRMRLDSYEAFFVFAASILLIYVVSFVVVTPTPDDRYMMPSIVICKVMLASLLIRLLALSRLNKC